MLRLLDFQVFANLKKNKPTKVLFYLSPIWLYCGVYGFYFVRNWLYSIDFNTYGKITNARFCIVMSLGVVKRAKCIDQAIQNPNLFDTANINETFRFLPINRILTGCFLFPCHHYVFVILSSVYVYFVNPFPA